MLATNLPRAVHHIFLASEPLEAYRTTGVNFVGRNANLSAQAIFETIGKPSRSVNHDRTRIDLAYKSFSVNMILSDNGIGVMRTIMLNVLDCLANVGDDAYRENRSQVLGVPIILLRWPTIF